MYCYQLGKLAFFENNPERSKEYSLQLIKISKEIGYQSGIYNGYYFFGLAEKELGNHTSSIQAFLTCLDYADQPHLRCEILTAIADVYKRSQDYKNAVSYYHQAIITVVGDSSNLRALESLAIAYLNLGDLYLLVADKADSALYFSLRAQEQLEKTNRFVARSNIPYAIGNAGLAYALKGDNAMAEIKIREAVEHLEQEEDYYPISIYYTYIADIYLERGDFQNALQYAQASLTMAESYQLKEQIRDAHHKLYELYKYTNQFNKALYHHELFLDYKDSIMNAESIRHMADLRTELEVSQKQAEVDLLNIQKRNQQIILFAVIGFAIILVVFAIIIYNYYRSKARINKILESQKQELERLNTTKDKFFSIISHDLRGPVHSFHGISRMIKFLVESKETDQLLEIVDDIDQSVDRLSSLLDNLLNWASQQQGHVPNAPEKIGLNEMVHEITATFETMAKGKGVELKSSIPEDIMLWADKNTTMTILRNLVNNALKFTESGGYVKISAEIQEHLAVISIIDNGVGIPQEKMQHLFRLQDQKSTYGTSGEKGLGLGLQLVHEFVEMNKGTIDVESTPDQGTTFTISLRLFEQKHQPA